MPKLDLSRVDTVVQVRLGLSGKLAPSRAMAASPVQPSWEDAGGLTQYGVNHPDRTAGGMSSLRHYHMEQDEFAI